MKTVSDPEFDQFAVISLLKSKQINNGILNSFGPGSILATSVRGSNRVKTNVQGPSLIPLRKYLKFVLPEISGSP
jgi:hypothetical protein